MTVHKFSQDYSFTCLKCANQTVSINIIGNQLDCPNCRVNYKAQNLIFRTDSSTNQKYTCAKCGRANNWTIRNSSTICFNCDSEYYATAGNIWLLDKGNMIEPQIPEPVELEQGEVEEKPEERFEKRIIHSIKAGVVRVALCVIVIGVVVSYLSGVSLPRTITTILNTGNYIINNVQNFCFQVLISSSHLTDYLRKAIIDLVYSNSIDIKEDGWSGFFLILFSSLLLILSSIIIGGGVSSLFIRKKSLPSVSFFSLSGAVIISLFFSLVIWHLSNNLFLSFLIGLFFHNLCFNYSKKRTRNILIKSSQFLFSTIPVGIALAMWAKNGSNSPNYTINSYLIVAFGLVIGNVAGFYLEYFIYQLIKVRRARRLEAIKKANEETEIKYAAELEKERIAQEAKRKAEEEAKKQAEEEAKRRARYAAAKQHAVELEAKRKTEEEAKRKAEEEAKRKVEEEAKRKTEEEAKRKAEEEAKRKAEEEAKRKILLEQERKDKEKAAKQLLAEAMASRQRLVKLEAKGKAESNPVKRIATRLEVSKLAQEEAARIHAFALEQATQKQSAYDNQKHWLKDGCQFNNSGQKAEFKYHALFDYFPSGKYPNVPNEVHLIRNKVWDFKNGINAEVVSKEVASAIWHKFNNENLLESLDTVFITIPASTRAKTEARFKIFSSLVSGYLGIKNGYCSIKVTEDRAPLKGTTGFDKISNLGFNSLEFEGKRVILFDDIKTTGGSFRQTARKLIDLGAIDIKGVFLAETYDSYSRGNPHWNR